MKDETTRVARSGTENPANVPTGTRPRVTASYAQTIDGRIATLGGSSQWISSPDSLRFAHELRATHDAILVGANTACSDDPSLTVRHVSGENPLRVVVDSTLRTPLSSAMFSDGNAENTLVATTASAPRDRISAAEEIGATVILLPHDPDGRVALKPLMQRLYESGTNSVMVEGGAGVITALIHARLVDRLAVCIAPKILGSGLDSIGNLGIHDLDDCVNLHNVSLKRYGPDFVMSGDVKYCDKDTIL